MKKFLLLVSVASLIAFQGIAANQHWKGVGGSGVGNFELASNWEEGSVPLAADLAAVNNRANANWAVTFNSEVTNTIGSLVSPSIPYESLFNLNGHVWTTTVNQYVWEGSGGKVTFTNGTLRTPALGGETWPPSGSTLTNHAVIAFQNVRTETIAASFGGTITSFEGGDHSVSNQMKVGTLSGASAYATVYLLKGVRVSVTNELHIGTTAGATGRVDVADADLLAGKTANYFGVNARSKGTLTINTGANVLLPGYCYVGLNGYGVVEQTGGICIASNSFDLAENSGARGELNLQGGQFVIRDLRPAIANSFRLGVSAGATGLVTLAGGNFSFPGASCLVGNAGYGQMTVTGGTNVFSGTLSLGASAGGAGSMTVSGGFNTFGSVVGTARLLVGDIGRGTLLAGGGTNSTCGIALGNGATGIGTMTLTNGLWTIDEHVWVGMGGTGSLTVNGGEMRFLNGGPVLAIGRNVNTTGEVSVAGGLVNVNGNVYMSGGSKALARLTLSGSGTLRTKAIYEKDPPAGTSQMIFDGGTLQAAATGLLVDLLDDVRLTTNGMVLDSAGYTVSVAPTLQDASGQAGAITKKGAGTLTLAGTRAATGPVSVLGGTLVASNGLAVAAGTSRIDGTLTLTSPNRLTVGVGAALAGTGTVAKVTLQDNAVFARAKADNAVTPITVSDCVADNRLTVALTGYALTDLKTPMALMRTPTAFMDKAKITVTLNGMTSANLTAKFVEVGGQQVLYASYSTGTMILVW
jgi:autotransporter-associated beta strand protein